MSNKIAEARAWARDAHSGQTDKLGVDYMEHVEAVAAAVTLLGEETVIVALLHDVAEDSTDPILSDIAEIRDRFGPTVGAAVEAMTKRDNEDYPAYLTRLRANPIARLVKTADIAHNVSRIPLLPDEATRTRLLRKYSAALKGMAEDA